MPKRFFFGFDALKLCFEFTPQTPPAAPSMHTSISLPKTPLPIVIFSSRKPMQKTARYTKSPQKSPLIRPLLRFCLAHIKPDAKAPRQSEIPDITDLIALFASIIVSRQEKPNRQSISTATPDRTEINEENDCESMTFLTNDVLRIVSTLFIKNKCPCTCVLGATGTIYFMKNGICLERLSQPRLIFRYHS